MVVIGFDPGSISFGVGILEKKKNSISYLHSEEIKLKEKDFYGKMKYLWERLAMLYTSFKIDAAAIEEGFLGKNVKTMNMLAKVRGVVLGSLINYNRSYWQNSGQKNKSPDPGGDNGIYLESYSPGQVKLALTGNGSALKSQVSKMVKKLLNINDKNLGNDESDALAVAYCHALNIK